MECDFSSTRRVALIPMPSVRIFRTKETVGVEVRNQVIRSTCVLVKTFATRLATLGLDDGAILQVVFTVLVN